jgi:hypothetical protein
MSCLYAFLYFLIISCSGLVGGIAQEGVIVDVDI